VEVDVCADLDVDLKAKVGNEDESCTLTLSLDGSVDDFHGAVEAAVCADLALSLGVSADQVVVLSVEAGSIILTVQVKGISEDDIAAATDQLAGQSLGGFTALEAKAAPDPSNPRGREKGKKAWSKAKQELLSPRQRRALDNLDRAAKPRERSPSSLRVWKDDHDQRIYEAGNGEAFLPLLSPKSKKPDVEKKADPPSGAHEVESEPDAFDAELEARRKEREKRAQERATLQKEAEDKAARRKKAVSDFQNKATDKAAKSAAAKAANPSADPVRKAAAKPAGSAKPPAKPQGGGFDGAVRKGDSSPGRSPGSRSGSPSRHVPEEHQSKLYKVRQNGDDDPRIETRRPLRNKIMEASKMNQAMVCKEVVAKGPQWKAQPSEGAAKSFMRNDNPSGGVLGIMGRGTVAGSPDDIAAVLYDPDYEWDEAQNCEVLEQLGDEEDVSLRWIGQAVGDMDVDYFVVSSAVPVDGSEDEWFVGSMSVKHPAALKDDEFTRAEMLMNGWYIKLLKSKSSESSTPCCTVTYVSVIKFEDGIPAKVQRWAGGEGARAIEKLNDMLEKL